MPPSPDLQQSMDIAPYMGNRHKDNPHLSGPNDVLDEGRYFNIYT